MGLSKSTRIMILLGIDSAFFLLELVVGINSNPILAGNSLTATFIGYAVHSLALVADSFHMVGYCDYLEKPKSLT